MMQDPLNLPPLCSNCGSERTARVKREGFLQRFLYDRFGFYPWACALCREVFVVRKRGKLKRKRRAAGEIHIPHLRENR